MSCTGPGFSVAWTPPWGGAAAAPSTGAQSAVQAQGAVAAGDIAVFADATGTKVRAATAEELGGLMLAKYVPIEGSTQVQPVKYVELDGVLYLQKDGDPVDAPWAT